MAFTNHMYLLLGPWHSPTTFTTCTTALRAKHGSNTDYYFILFWYHDLIGMQALNYVAMTLNHSFQGLGPEADNKYSVNQYIVLYRASFSKWC